MAEERLEKEVIEALEYIKKGENFLLEGGAGSGKTYSLVSLINKIFSDDPSAKIVCITYTNNAVAEILSRVQNDNLQVSTIHEFLWKLISKYQNEIKIVLVSLINDSKETKFRLPNDFEGESITLDYFAGVNVDYDEYYSMTIKDEKVKISHDHVLIVAEKLFEKYNKLSDILKDTANYIFIDEYQDTSPLVTKILLKHLKKSSKKNVIGFFGDSMQSIYDGSVGDLNEYESELKRINKKQNRRNPRSVIEVANKFRNDGIVQVPSTDIDAPNMANGSVIEGTVKFLYSYDHIDFSKIKGKSIFRSWDFTDGEHTRELRLTHKYNAEMAGFKNLYSLYNDDLIVKLFNKIAKKYKLDIDEDKTFCELVAAYDNGYKGKTILEQIECVESYKTIYDELKDKQLDNIKHQMYINKDSLMSYKYNGLHDRYESNSNRDPILRKLDEIEEIVELYNDNKLNEFLKITKFTINSKEDKILLKNIMDALTKDDSCKSIEDILNLAIENSLIKEDDTFKEFISNRGKYLWRRIKDISFKEYRDSIKYLKEYTPICTQHSVKGSEYDNVFLVLESNWNKYDFKTLFGQGSKSESVQLRTRKLFYVCITRAKKNLIIYMPNMNEEMLQSVRLYFGENNVLNVAEMN